MGQLALDDYWFYLRAVLGYSFLDPWDHGEELVAFVEKNLYEPMLIMVPRGGCKSGTITVPMLPWLLAKDPTLCGIVTNLRETKAAKFAREAAAIIESPRYQACFPHVRKGNAWSVKGYYLQRDKALEAGAQGRIDPNIMSYGVGGNMTGAHVKALLHDDLINEETSRSVLELEKAEGFFKESLNCLDPGGVLALCCTRWRFNDFYGKIENGELQGPSGPFKIFKRGAERWVTGEDGEPVKEIFNPHRIFVDMKGNTQQVGYSPEFLEARRKTLGDQYWALYQNTPLSSEDHDFELERIVTFEKFPGTLGPMRRVGIELEASATSFYELLVREMRECNLVFGIDKLTNARTLEKHDKIRGVLQPLISAGRLAIRKDVWENRGGLGQEIKEFDKGEDDALDALVHAVERARPWHQNQAPEPYLAVDPAYTAKKRSNHTAIVVGVWYQDVFYVLECHKFKTQKPTMICGQMFRLYHKYAHGVATKGKIDGSPAARMRGWCSPGNERKYRPRNGWGDVFGNGLYVDDFKPVWEQRYDGSDENVEGE